MSIKKIKFSQGNFIPIKRASIHLLSSIIFLQIPWSVQIDQNMMNISKKKKERKTLPKRGNSEWSVVGFGAPVTALQRTLMIFLVNRVSNTPWCVFYIPGNCRGSNRARRSKKGKRLAKERLVWSHEPVSLLCLSSVTTDWIALPSSANQWGW